LPPNCSRSFLSILCPQAVSGTHTLVTLDLSMNDKITAPGAAALSHMV
jgi:hypothetical protein